MKRLKNFLNALPDLWRKSKPCPKTKNGVVAMRFISDECARKVFNNTPTTDQTNNK